MKDKMRGSWKARTKRTPEKIPTEKNQEVAHHEETTIHENVVDRDRSEKIWSQFLALAVEISKRWEGASAVDEIRSQRGGNMWL